MIVFFAPHNIHLEPIIEGLKEAYRGELLIAWYDEFQDIDATALNIVAQYTPHLVIYDGQNGSVLINSDTFCRIKEICPTVLIVHDGSDATWRHLLHEYRERDCFSVMVNIDGNSDWEHSLNDITAITPTAQEFYS